MPRRRPRAIPAELAHALRTVRALEADAATTAQRQAAIRATAQLLLASVQAGWRTHELAPVVGLNPPAARQRVQAARRRGDQLGIAIPQPPQPRRPLAGLVAVPAEQREWLRSDEACAYARISRATLRSWRRAGLLPNTDWHTPNHPVYLRADLLRVLHAPTTRHGRGVNHQALREMINRSAV
jgi:hypothetical protein